MTIIEIGSSLLSCKRLCLAVVILSIAGAASGQSQDTSATIHQLPGSGLRLLELSTFESWATGPSGGGPAAQLNEGGLITGGTLSVGLSAPTRHGQYSLRYTASSFWLQQLHSTVVDHAIDISGSDSLSARTILRGGATATLLNTSNLLFLLPSLAPAGQSQFDPSQPPSVSSAAVTGVQARFYGQRTLQAHVNGAFERRQTQRLTWSLFADGTRTQNVAELHEPSNTVSPGLPAMTMVQSGFQTTYLSSERTSLGLSVADQEISSFYDRSRAANVSASVSRLFRSRLRVAVRGGVSYISMQNGLEDTGHVRGFVDTFGVEAAYPLKSAQLTFSIARTGMDPYGIGATSTLTAFGAWTYRRPGSRTGLQISANWQHLNSVIFGSLDFLQLTAGLTRRIGRDADGQLSYVFTTTTSPVRDQFLQGNLSAVRFTLAWRPTKLRIL